LLSVHRMTTFPKSFGDFAARVARPLGRIVTAQVGFVMSIVGLAMGVSIVMFPLGMVLALTGIAVLLCGVFAAPASTDA